MENKALKVILDNKAVAVIRVSSPNKLIKVAEAIYKGGVKSVEITMTVPGALKIIEEASKTVGDYINIGVGSVLNKQTSADAINAGAQYVVSPVFKLEVVHEVKKHNIPVMPGAFSPTEILAAFEAGADIVKVFPADIVGMAFFKGVLAPMPHLKLMPTGGVSLTNAGDWLKTGACAVGVGSALLDKKAIEEENFDKLTQNAEKLMSSITKAKEELHLS
jgi:2-dehydro-3-deoxyphosphogluconate aldolase / (4S)-4-hydroxy-2-oxoglutarate aldolase